MPAKWQQWMPFHIDKFNASPWVQAMHPAAQSGYIRLLAEQWQTDEGSISSDPEELAILSGLGRWGLWDEHAKTILRHFPKLEDGRIRNEVCHREWLTAKQIFDDGQREWTQISEARSRAGKIGNEIRWKSKQDRKSIAKPSQPDRTTVANDRFTYTETGTGTETSKELSEAKASSPRTPSGKPDPVEAIYQAYPRRIGRGAALKAIHKAIKRICATGQEPRQAQVFLYQRVQAFARSPAGQDGEFTPYPATWFNQGRYDDDPQEWQRKANERGTSYGNSNQGRGGITGDEMSRILDSLGGSETGDPVRSDEGALFSPA